MKIMSKTVVGSTEALKLVSNGKQAPTTPTGGPVGGKTNSNKTLLAAPGLIGEAPVMMGDTSFADSFVKAGNRGSVAGEVTPASESVTGGMGGKFIKKPKGVF